MSRPRTTKSAPPIPATPKATAARTPNQREDIDKWLRDHGAIFEFYDEFDLDLIDVQRSLHNQARIATPLTEAQVETYVEAMERGEIFPPIVVVESRTKPGTYVVVDGNHRVAAANKAGVNLAAYVLHRDTNPTLITILTFEANTKHGLPTSREERARHAIYLIENASESIKGAAARMAVPTNFLERFYGSYRADERVRRLKVPQGWWTDITATARLRLNSLPSDEVFIAAVELAHKMRMGFSDVDALVRTLRPIGSTAEQLQHIERFEQEHRDRIVDVATGKAGGRGRYFMAGPRQSLRSAMTMINSLRDAEKRAKLLDDLTPEEAQDFANQLKSTELTYRELIEELEKKAKVGVTA